MSSSGFAVTIRLPADLLVPHQLGNEQHKVQHNVRNRSRFRSRLLQHYIRCAASVATEIRLKIAEQSRAGWGPESCRKSRGQPEKFEFTVGSAFVQFYRWAIQDGSNRRKDSRSHAVIKSWSCS